MSDRWRCRVCHSIHRDWFGGQCRVCKKPGTLRKVIPGSVSEAIAAAVTETPKRQRQLFSEPMT